MWVYNSQTDSMESREVSYVPGLYKIFDEVLVNAADNKQRDKNMDEVRVNIDREHGFISVRNNGRGIPIEIHSVSEMTNDMMERELTIGRKRESTCQNLFSDIF